MDLLLQRTYVAERAHFWFKGFRAFIAPLLAQAAGGRRNLRLLDCGCGTGNNLSLLDEYGQSYGFDLTRLGLVFGSREYGRRRLAQGSVTHIPFRDNAFDLLTSFDVLQSVDTTGEALAMAEFFRLLRPGGHVLLNVAALELLRGSHSVVAFETRRYDKTMMRSALEHAGFTVERLTYTNFTLFPLVLPHRMFQRLMGIPALEETGNDLELPARPVNALLTAALLFEAKLLRVTDLPFGSSLLALARKP